MNAFIAVHKGYSATSASPAGLSHDVGSVEARLQLDIHHQVGVKGLLGFGMGFGILAAIVRSAGRVPMRASGSDIQVAEKTETKPVAYLENVPRSIMEKETLDKLLSTLPREQWENPPEDSYLYTLKMFAETYGEGKATKMGWWDYWYMRVNMPDADEFYSGEELA